MCKSLLRKQINLYRQIYSKQTYSKLNIEDKAWVREMVVHDEAKYLRAAMEKPALVPKIDAFAKRPLQRQKNKGQIKQPTKKPSGSCGRLTVSRHAVNGLDIFYRTNANL